MVAIEWKLVLVVLAGSLSVALGASAGEPSGGRKAKRQARKQTKATPAVRPLKDLSAVMPTRGAASTEPARQWQFAMVTGNGRMGAMVFGDPAAETIVANHCRLYLPLGSREVLPDLAKHVPELRRIIRTKGYGAAMGFFLGEARKQGFPGLIWTDPFHPGFELKLTQQFAGGAADYVRTEDFQTGVVEVRWRAASGVFRRRLFVSRVANVIALSVTGPGPGAVTCELAMAPIAHKLIDSTIATGPSSIACHNVYRKGKGGYDGQVRVIVRGGQVDCDGSTLRIAKADELLALARIEPFTKLAQSDPKKLAADLAALPADFAALLRPHAKAHGELFNRVTLDVGGGDGRARSTEDLLAAAASEGRLPPALLEKMYDAGRYMFICCAGELPPNLQGIWTGTWKPAWSGDFTLDTNLQLALKSGFSGNMTELMEGYFRLIESALPEFRENASKYYGCRGIYAPTRMSNTGLMLHWGKWPGIFWTAGAGWLAHFFYDHYRYTGDREFLARRTVPLLKEVALFYEDFLTVDPNTGNCEFIPSYSPETGCGITSTMDVMVATEALSTLVAACEELGIEKQGVARWKAMLAKMPAYRINADGALAEWVPPGGPEHYRHRHLSHLHAAYEATGELDPEKDPKLWKAAQEATRRRINSNGEQSTHGRMHMALAAAYLGMGEEAYGRLAIMAVKKSMYPSLMCSHEPGQRVFNVDGNGAIPEVVHRMLLRSSLGKLELLPALPKALPTGSIEGILARKQIHIDRLEWDRPAGRIRLTLTSSVKQTITLSVPDAERITVKVAAGKAQSSAAPKPNRIRLELPAGEPVTLGISATF